MRTRLRPAFPFPGLVAKLDTVVLRRNAALLFAIDRLGTLVLR